MLSKIRIDIDEVNEPIIVIEAKISDDVRDKLVRKFLEGLGEKDKLRIHCVDSGAGVNRWEVRSSDEKESFILNKGSGEEGFGYINGTKVSCNQVTPVTNGYFRTTNTGDYDGVKFKHTWDDELMNP